LGGRDLTAVFDVLGSDYLKMAFTDAGGNELYWEVEDWDSSGEEAHIWVKVPSVSPSEDTVLHLYFDPDQADNSTYGGLPDSAAAENVWDIHCIIVSHMLDDPDTSHVRDSTGNDNDGEKGAAGQPAEAAGEVGEGQDFSAGHYVQFADNGIGALLNAANKLTVSILFKPAVGAPDTLFSKAYPYCTLRYDNPPTFRLRIDAVAEVTATSAHSPAFGSFHHYVGKWDGSDVKIYVDGGLEGTTNHPGNLNLDNSVIYVCKNAWGGSGVGVVDEVRVYDDDRSDAEIKADYESCRDHLVSAGYIEMQETMSFASTRQPINRRPPIDLGLVESLVQYLSNKLTDF
jgi:hypothetical protein